MSVLHTSVRALCAAYFAVSLTVTSIVLHAMWDSSIVVVEVPSKSGIKRFEASQNINSATSTPVHKGLSPVIQYNVCAHVDSVAVVCSAISEDETFPVLVASLGIFTATLQVTLYLPFCRHLHLLT